jgi:hypothetical protein
MASVGHLLISLVGLVTAFGGLMADWNETHVKNPNWPPHARFHNGQTMSMGLALGLFTLYLTWRASITKSTPERSLESTFIAAITGSLYWITGMSAILYPGSNWHDPEYEEGQFPPQIPLFSTLFILSWGGYILERQRLSPEIKRYKAKEQ